MYVYQCLNGGMTYSNHININTREHESDIMMSCHCSWLYLDLINQVE